MPRFTTSFTVDLPVDAVFSYLADFTNLAEWDPAVRDATRVRGDGPGVGDRVRLAFGIGPATVGLDYTTTVHDRPHHVAFEPDARLVRGVDDIRLSAVGDGATRVQWRAVFGFAGPGRLVDPVLGPGFQRVAERAVDGLRARLDELAAAAGAQPDAAAR